MSARRIEDLDQLLDQIIKEGADVGRAAERAAVEAGRSAPESRKPDLTASLVTDLRATLADEVVVSRPAEGDGVISEREEHREIAKRALAHIKLPQLRLMASDMGLARGGNLEEVLDRIVNEVKADEEAIARLVIEYETEPPPERRFLTRLFPLTTGVDDLAPTSARLRGYISRYFRVGIARWTVVDDVQGSAARLRLLSTYRYFTADAAREAEEDYSLRASRHSAQTELRVHAGRPFAQVDAPSVTAGRAAVTTLDHATSLEPATGGLSFSARPSGGPLFGWDPRTVFLIDLLSSRFRSDAIEVLNLTTAGFERSESATATEESANRPAVRAVRLQGQHLLDSRPASDLIVRGQGLVELSLTLRWTEPDPAVTVPVTIRIERDNVAVTTGFGTNSPNVARHVHRLLVDAVECAYESPQHDSPQVQQLAREMSELAASPSPAEEARLFATTDR
jgi:hypothetical protein